MELISDFLTIQNVFLGIAVIGAGVLFFGRERVAKWIEALWRRK